MDFRHTDNFSNRFAEIFRPHHRWMAKSNPTTASTSGFGARLKRWREERGFSHQGKFAEALGVKQASLSELETGQSKSPSAVVLMKACELLNLRPLYLLHGEGPPEAQNFSELSGPEAQLVMLYRALPNETMRHALLIDVEARTKQLAAPDPGAWKPGDKRLPSGSIAGAPARTRSKAEQ